MVPIQILWFYSH